jgi:iron complex outermembrane receptor protein
VLFLNTTEASTQGKKPPPKGPPDLTELNLEDLMKIEVQTVYGASKFLQKVTEAPSSITIVTADDIQRYGYRTFADILKSVRSFVITNDRAYSYIGVRSFSRPGDFNSLVLLMVNGHRVNDNIYNGAAIGTEFVLDVDLIDRVEIIRGPSSSLYGTNAFFAVINVVTRSGKSVEGVEVSGELASLDGYKGRITYGNEFRNGLQLLLSGTFYNSAGHRRLFFKEFDDPTTNNGVAENADSDEFSSFFANLSSKHFTFYAAHSGRTKRLPTAALGTIFNDNRTKTSDYHGYVDLKYERTFENNVDLLARAYYDHFYYQARLMYNRSTTDEPFVIENRDYAGANWAGAELAISRRLFSKHKITLGGEFRDAFNQSLGNKDINPSFEYINVNPDADNKGVYIQDEFSLNKNLILNAGVRYDYYSETGGTTNPRLALIYTPARNTTLKLLYGRAFRAPDPYELAYLPAGDSTSVRIQPETVKTTEVVVERYQGDRLRFAASFFYYDADRLLSYQINSSTGAVALGNLRQVDSVGIETEAEAKFNNGIEAGISYSVQEARKSPTDELLPNSPKHIAKLNLFAPILKDRLSAGLDLQYMSDRMTYVGDPLEEFAVCNLTLLTKKLVKGTDLSFSVYNLFDANYADPAPAYHRSSSIQQDGRTFRLKITYRFSSASRNP